MTATKLPHKNISNCYK